MPSTPPWSPPRTAACSTDSRAAGEEKAYQSAELIARDTPPPGKASSDLEAQLAKIIVSHRADHGRIDKEARKHGRDSTADQLHQETAYSIVDDMYVASRTDLLSVKPAQLRMSPVKVVTSATRNCARPCAWQPATDRQGHKKT